MCVYYLRVLQRYWRKRRNRFCDRARDSQLLPIKKASVIFNAIIKNGIIIILIDLARNIIEHEYTCDKSARGKEKRIKRVRDE